MLRIRENVYFAKNDLLKVNHLQISGHYLLWWYYGDTKRNMQSNKNKYGI